MNKIKHRAFLKWAGGKFGIVEHIATKLPKAKTLIEPFVGAGSVFLNTDYKHYVLNDINADLINLYQILQSDFEQYITEASPFFTAEFNQSDKYYEIREQFNQSQDKFERAVLFLYLNRFGYNGLCRYNKSGIFNVPFGRYKKPYFPEKEIRYFAEKAQKAEFTCVSFEECMNSAPQDATVYCDPPYAPISATAYFTSYAKNGFNLEYQTRLAIAAQTLKSEKGNRVLISNHDTPFTREIYQGAEIQELQVARFISRKGHTRAKVSELLALY
ncbi:MAG: Dam family site-specific DNA-(adenine-N6)-methyltransferase [Aestuariibacter sp.]